MSENKEWIQLPPMKKDTPTEVVEMIWEYLKLPQESRKKVLEQMDEIEENSGKSGFKIPDLYETISREEISGIESTMQKIITGIIAEASGVACWVYVEKYIHEKSLKQMIDEWKDAEKFIIVMDTLFEEYLGAQE